MNKGNPQKPILIIVIGVSGSGKSTLAKNIANYFKLNFIEADDFHSDEAVELMSCGTALNDNIRDAWVDRLSTHLDRQAADQNSCCLAFSGLKEKHRQRIKRQGFNNYTIYLHGSSAEISERMEKRSEHFMPASLLQSQFDALELPAPEVNLLEVDIALRPHQQLENVIHFISPQIKI